MFGSSDSRWGDDPRHDAQYRGEHHERSDVDETDRRGRSDQHERDIEREHGWDVRDRDPDDPREREIVWDREQTYELNGEDCRTLAAVGAFRIVPEGDLRDDTLDTRSDSLDQRNRRFSGEQSPEPFASELSGTFAQ